MPSLFFYGTCTLDYWCCQKLKRKLPGLVSQDVCPSLKSPFHLSERFHNVILNRINSSNKRLKLRKKEFLIDRDVISFFKVSKHKLDLKQHYEGMF